MTPFLSFYTPTYRRPHLLARCQASVDAQTIPCEHIIIPDTVGIGIPGVFASVPTHAHKVTGEYVHFLTDDDYLASNTVAAQLQAIAAAHDRPDVIIVRAIKDVRIHDHWVTLDLPLNREGPPMLGQIDLGCVVTRRDVWMAHVQDYGARYEGDFDHVHAMWRAGRRFVYTDLIVLRGKAMHGNPE